MPFRWWGASCVSRIPRTSRMTLCFYVDFRLRTCLPPFALFPLALVFVPYTRLEPFFFPTLLNCSVSCAALLLRTDFAHAFSRRGGEFPDEPPLAVRLLLPPIIFFAPLCPHGSMLPVGEGPSPPPHSFGPLLTFSSQCDRRRVVPFYPPMMFRTLPPTWTQVWRKWSRLIVFFFYVLILPLPPIPSQHLSASTTPPERPQCFQEISCLPLRYQKRK